MLTTRTRTGRATFLVGPQAKLTSGQELHTSTLPVRCGSFILTTRQRKRQVGIARATCDPCLLLTMWIKSRKWHALLMNIHARVTRPEPFVRTEILMTGCQLVLLSDGYAWWLSLDTVGEPPLSLLLLSVAGLYVWQSDLHVLQSTWATLEKYIISLA